METQSLAKTILLLVLAVVGVGFAVFLVAAIRRMHRQGSSVPTGAPGPLDVIVGFVTDFFDALGVGSFATTTTIFRLTKRVDDKLIPGTLNVGHALPTIAQALIFTQVVPVETKTLFILIATAVAGSYLGAGIVVRLPKRAVQLGMGVALFVAAMFMLFAIFSVKAAGGTALGLTGGTLVLAAVINFILGALMTLGIGLYAPCLIMVSLLGMNPTAAFPIMMCSCAFLMPTASYRFVKEAAFHPKATLGLILGGIPGVLVAAYVVKSLELNTVRWLVVVVVIYTALGLLWSAMKSKGNRPAGAEGTLHS